MIFYACLVLFLLMSLTTQKDLRSREEKRQQAVLDTRPRRTISFYRYVRLDNPEAFRDKLLQKWSEHECMGRIYVASEGINAQMNVLEERFDEWDAWVQAQPELAGVPYKVAVEEGEAPSFYKLTIKVRDKIVADGLDDSSFDVTNVGEYLTAEEMNQYIDDPDAVVVDMRNNYESEVGHFKGAITPNVVTFRDELKETPKTLRIHKDKKIALYCTGGIRCEKASAWLKHNGYKNVKHLKGGIIDYKRQVDEQGLENKFLGKNFVFDERLGERIGDEIIATCHLCRTTKADNHYHCKNQICHTLFISCDTCLERKRGYCSKKCEMLDQLPATWKRRLARLYNTYIRRRKNFNKTKLA